MDMWFKRFNSDGTDDTNFGTNGTVNVDISGSFDIPDDIVIQPDRKMVIGGTAWFPPKPNGTDRDFALVRLEAGPVPPNMPIYFNGGSGTQSSYNITNLGSPQVTNVSAAAFPNTPPPFISANADFAGGVVNRYYDLSVIPQNAGSTSPYSATLRLYYSDEEANGLDGNKLRLIRYDGSGWYLVGGSVNTAENYVEASGVSEFNLFALADPDSILVSTGPDLDEQIITEFQLQQNYPNPFNPSTVIRYQLPVSGPVKLAVFDIIGQAVATVLDEEQVAGAHSVSFNASQLAGGIYFYRLQAGALYSNKEDVIGEINFELPGSSQLPGSFSDKIKFLSCCIVIFFHTSYPSQ